MELTVTPSEGIYKVGFFAFSSRTKFSELLLDLFVVVEIAVKFSLDSILLHISLDSFIFIFLCLCKKLKTLKKFFFMEC